jgi:hypothetical protein
MGNNDTTTTTQAEQVERLVATYETYAAGAWGERLTLGAAASKPADEVASEILEDFDEEAAGFQLTDADDAVIDIYSELLEAECYPPAIAAAMEAAAAHGFGLELHEACSYGYGYGRVGVHVVRSLHEYHPQGWRTASRKLEHWELEALEADELAALLGLLAVTQFLADDVTGDDAGEIARETMRRAGLRTLREELREVRDLAERSASPLRIFDRLEELDGEAGDIYEWEQVPRVLAAVRTVRAELEGLPVATRSDLLARELRVLARRAEAEGAAAPAAQLLEMADELAA